MVGLPPLTCETQKLLGGRAADAHELGLRRAAALDFDVARRHAELFGEQARELLVGRALHGRRGHAHPERPAVLAARGALRRARHDAHAEGERAFRLCALDHVVVAPQKKLGCQPRSNVTAMAVWKSQMMMMATMGEMSNMPSGGIICLSGTRSGSVTRTRKRITGLT